VTPPLPDQIRHRAGLLRLVTAETAASPDFRERMAADLNRIADAMQPAPAGWATLENVR
jgi:hypothetical protein